jgi:hypothetical protein
MLFLLLLFFGTRQNSALDAVQLVLDACYGGANCPVPSLPAQETGSIETARNSRRVVSFAKFRTKKLPLGQVLDSLVTLPTPTGAVNNWTVVFPIKRPDTARNRCQLEPARTVSLQEKPNLFNSAGVIVGDCIAAA